MIQFLIGVLVGACAGLIGGVWLDAKDVLYSCPRCKRKGNANDGWSHEGGRWSWSRTDQERERRN